MVTRLFHIIGVQQILGLRPNDHLLLLDWLVVTVGVGNDQDLLLSLHLMPHQLGPVSPSLQGGLLILPLCSLSTYLDISTLNSLLPPEPLCLAMLSSVSCMGTYSTRTFGMMACSSS